MKHFVSQLEGSPLGQTHPFQEHKLISNGLIGVESSMSLGLEKLLLKPRPPKTLGLEAVRLSLSTEKGMDQLIPGTEGTDCTFYSYVTSDRAHLMSCVTCYLSIHAKFPGIPGKGSISSVCPSQTLGVPQTSFSPIGYNQQSSCFTL